LDRLAGDSGWNRKGETEKQAVMRELKEEAGIEDIQIIAKVPHTVQYDYPPDVKRQTGFDGARQKIYLVKLLSGEIKAATEEHDKCK